MAMLIKPNGSVEEVMPAGGKMRFTLDEMYEILDCTQVQLVYLEDDRAMWLDEEAKMRPRSEWKARNAMATDLLMKAGGIPGDVVLGNVLVYSLEETEADDE